MLYLKPAYYLVAKSFLSQLPRDLSRKANQVLFGYGGLEGLAKNPAWLINEVLSAFFTNEERKEILGLKLFGEARNEVLRIFLNRTAA